MSTKTGRIIKGVGGLYTVNSNGKEYLCKARGAFRNKNITPAPGDIVDFTDTKNESSNCSIENIHNRKNEFRRPFIANIDVLLIAASVNNPPPNLYLIDKLIAIATLKEILPIVVVTKSDLDEDKAKEIYNIYSNAGIKCFIVSSVNKTGIQEFKEQLKNKLCVFAGISGVGKSSLINELDINIDMIVGSLSEKSGHGKHTTRHTEIFFASDNILIADTPGFSTIWTREYDNIIASEVKDGFIEFSRFKDDCKFKDCSHNGGENCGIIKALNAGKIEKSRYENYLLICEELKDAKKWQK
ncbi:MAG: ribosome small subunit-dependent GTPase A [Clostridia bacterium]